MSESNPIKIPPPVPATSKQEGSPVAPKVSEGTAPISIQFPKKVGEVTKITQAIQIPTVPSPAKAAPKPPSKPISIPKAELKSDSIQRLGGWFKPKTKSGESSEKSLPIPISVASPTKAPVKEEVTPTPAPPKPILSEEKPKAEEKPKVEESAFPWVARDRSDEKPEILLPLVETSAIPIVKKEVSPPPSISAPLSTPTVATIKISPELIEKPKESTPPPSEPLPPFIKSGAPSPLVKSNQLPSVEKKEEEKKKPEPSAASLPSKESLEQPPGLLSRKRYEEKGVKAESVTSEPKAKKPFPLWLRIILWILIPSAIAGAGYAYYLHYRETKLVGQFSLSSLRLDKKIYIVNNFSADVHVLAGEYKERLQPVRDQIKDREVVVRRVKGDLSSIESRVKLVDQERASVQKEIDLQMESGKSYQKRIWETEGLVIEKEYDRQLELFHKSVQERVKVLQIKWEPGDLRSPEVWANAFRLGLYDTPKSVKSSVERTWIEKELQKWRELEKQSENGKEGIRDRIDQYQEKINEKVLSFKEKAQVLEMKALEAGQELAPLKEELAHAERDLKESQNEEKSYLDYYYKQILELPEKNIRMAIDLRADNTFYWGKIHENRAFPAGSYLLFAKGKKGEEDYWTLLEIPLVDFHKTDLEITQSAFMPLIDYLKE